jgi:hypothetical protein
MKLIVSALFVSLVIVSCSRNNSTPTKGDVPTIKNLVKNLNLLPPGFKYDLTLQDNKGYYRANKTDTLFFPEYMSVMGYLPDTSKYYEFLYLEPGDDFYPAIKVFSKSGSLIDAKTIAYGDCAAGGCEIDSCASVIKIIDKSSIEGSILLKGTKCDSLGNKVTGGEFVVRKSKNIRISSNGYVEFSAEKLN